MTFDCQFVIVNCHFVGCNVQELEMLQSSLSSLKVAQAKFGDCKESLGKIGSSAESKDILVPLTSSVSFLLFSLYICYVCTQWAIKNVPLNFCQ